jgi:hypothetical protein
LAGSLDWGIEAFDVGWAEILVLKQTSQNLSGREADDDAVGVGKGLETGGKVGSLTNNTPFLSLPRSNQITDNHQPCRDAYSDL